MEIDDFSGRETWSVKSFSVFFFLEYGSFEIFICVEYRWKLGGRRCMRLGSIFGD